MSPAKPETRSYGRHQGQVALLGWRTRANLGMAAMAALAAVTWHVTLVLVSDGLGITDWARTLRALVQGHPLAASPDPTGRPSAVLAVSVWALVCVLGFAVYVAAVAARARARSTRWTQQGIADKTQATTALGEQRARTTAALTRPGMDEHTRRRAGVDQVGLPFGTTLHGAALVASFEEHLLVLAPTGVGKSTQVLIPAALTAPGALVVTSTRADVLDVIATPRSKVGRVWVFDPLDRVGWPEPMVWDPVAGAQNSRIATSRAMGFAAGLAKSQGVGNESFFEDMATQALTYMLHAAALTGGTIEDVLDWTISLSEDQGQAARQIITTATDPAAQRRWAGMLASLATGADETVSSTRMQLQRSVRPLMDTAVLARLTPRAGVPVFDAAEFVRSSDTLVLISDDTATTNVGPLTSMLFQEVVDEVKMHALRLPAGRLDPPMRIVGDEIANVAPIKLLPALASDLRGYGVQLLIGVQTDSQLIQRWGTHGAATLTGNMAIEIALPGIRDTGTLERLSQLAGSVDIDEITATFGDDQSVSGQNLGPRERRTLRPEEIRMLGDGHALVLFRNAAPIIATLTPWYARPDAATLTRDARATAARRTREGLTR